MIAAEVIEVTKLLEVMLDAIVATIGVTVLFSLAVLGISRVSDRREREHSVIGYGALAVLCLLGCLGVVIFGVTLLAHK